MLNYKVLLFYEEQDVHLLRIITDRGTEYCGAREHHEFQLYLAIEDIDHTRTKARNPQTNGICERFHRTIQDEFYSIAFRKKIYNSIEELQKDLDQWIDHYNNERTHTGKYCFGRTPMQTWLESKHLADEKNLDNKFQNFVHLPSSGEAETGSGGDQPARNNLTNRNEDGAKISPSINVHFGKDMPNKTH